MDVSRKRKGNLETSRPPKKVTKQPPPVRPSSTASLDDISFKQLSGDVWEQYKLETDIEPGCHLALMKKYPHSTVFIHQVSVAPEKIINLKPVVHRNIVHLRHVYTGGEQISMVYEMTIASLKDILSFRPHWSVAETAAVCQSVLSALKYMHGTLGVSHGNLDARTIRVDWNGTVKLCKGTGAPFYPYY
jgi:serine/threonine protein kinase